jgi:maltose O-acetyltransferase
MRDRMRAGQLYIADDPELKADNLRAQGLLERYNATSATEPTERAAILQELLGSCGKRVTILPPLRVDYGQYIHIGEATFINYDCILLDVAEIRIGANCQIAPRVSILTATHPVEPGPRAAGWESGEPITIGDNVWLGAGVIVLPGVSIGDDSVIGAGAVVTKDIPAGVVAVGNPARVVRTVS